MSSDWLSEMWADTLAHVEDDLSVENSRTLCHIKRDRASREAMMQVSILLMDNESIAAVEAMQATIAALTHWRDDTCFGGLLARRIECHCPVCEAIRANELAIAHIQAIFE